MLPGFEKFATGKWWWCEWSRAEQGCTNSST